MGLSDRGCEGVQRSYLTTQIFHFYGTTLESHHQTRLELILGTIQLGLRYWAISEQTKLVDKVREDLTGGVSTLLTARSRNERSEEAEK